MTNLGFHRLMAERGIRVLTTDVGDRYVLEALRAEGAVLGGEQSGHIVFLDGHVTGDGLAAALLLCRALGGRRLSQAAAVLTRLPQARENIAVGPTSLSPAVLEEVERLGAGLDGRGRILVRPSGTEPLVRVLVESESAEEAAALCGSSRLLDRVAAPNLGWPAATRHVRGCCGVTSSPGRRGRRRRDANVRDHRIRGSEGVQGAAAVRPRAARVPGLRFGRDRAPRGRRPAAHPRRRQPPEPEARRRQGVVTGDDWPRPHALGDARRRHTPRTRTRSLARIPQSSRSCSTGSSRTTGTCASACAPQGTSSRPRPMPKPSAT